MEKSAKNKQLIVFLRSREDEQNSENTLHGIIENVRIFAIQRLFLMLTNNIEVRVYNLENHLFLIL